MRSAVKLAPTVADAGQEVPYVFSPEPDRRAVEEAFVVRFMAAAASSTARVLERADHPRHEATLDDDLKRMRHPVFARMARIFEQSVPTDADFGPFRKE